MNFIQWTKLDCIHKHVCFLNGIKCGEFICKDFQPAHTCRPIAKPNVWGFCDFYCECGNKLLEVANGIDEYLPNYCSNCGAKVI